MNILFFQVCFELKSNAARCFAVSVFRNMVFKLIYKFVSFKLYLFSIDDQNNLVFHLIFILLKQHVLRKIRYQIRCKSSINRAANAINNFFTDFEQPENLFVSTAIQSILSITTMRYHRKLHLIKSLSKRVRDTQVSNLLHTQQQLYSSYFQPNGCNSEDADQNQLEDIEENEVQNGQDGLDLSDYIDTLPEDMILKIRKVNPQLPDIFFMNKKQKKEYFEKMNKSFKEKITKAPQRKSKTKKILKFKNNFEIMPFNEKKKVIEVSKGKNIYENYQADIHFS